MTTYDTSRALAAENDLTTARRLAEKTSAVIACVLSGLFSGFFLTYTMSVVVGLAEVDDVTYVSTFQSINATIRNPTFALVFFGTVPAALLAIVLGTSLGRGQRRMLGLGTALLFATMLIAFVWSIPLNDALAAYTELDAESASIARAEFEQPWNRWNLIRTCVAVLGTACVVSSLLALPGRREQTS